MGRPSTLTKAVMEAIEKKVLEGAALSSAGRLCGVVPQTTSQWMRYARDDPEKKSGDGTRFSDFADTIKKAEAAYRQTLVQIVNRAAVKTWQAAAWMLERRYPMEFGRFNRHEISTPKDQPLSLQTYVQMALDDPGQFKVEMKRLKDQQAVMEATEEEEENGETP